MSRPLVPLATLRARNAMVCSVDHLASAAGLDVARHGGSAVDAAVATSAVLAVTCQHMCGMGGDLWAIVHAGDDGPPACLDAAGRAGSGADPDALRAEGHRAMPFRNDIRSVTVPGCVDGWVMLHERFGRLPLSEVLAPAIHYATEGFPATPLLALAIGFIRDVEGADAYLDDEVDSGTVIRRPDLARTLEAVAGGGRTAFYEGEFGAGLLALGDGLYDRDDLARSQADWVRPLSTELWGHTVWTTPPPSQGYLSLASAAVAQRIGLPDDETAGAWIHLLVEAARLTGFDRPAVLHDGADGAALLSDDRIDRAALGFDPDHRADVGPAPAAAGDTIYLCTADREQAVSLIQSNASGWGAHLTVPGTGVFLHNRGLGFSLEPGHPAELGPGREPPHTLSPASVSRSGGAWRAVLGTMGGDGQPQTVLQMLARLLGNGGSPAAAVGAPRFRLARRDGGGFGTWTGNGPDVVAVEDNAPPGWFEGLAARGHEVAAEPAFGPTFGHAHCIERDEHGVLAGAADPRSFGGSAAGW